jgi:uncharacterized protein (TIGR02001 family)
MACRSLVLGCAAVASGLAVPARAQAELDLSANAGIVSDYRFRGVSLSDRGPALQGGADIEAGPVFAGAWASTIADYEGAEVELDLYGGLQGSVGEVAWRAGAYAYLYPGGADVNYVEFVGQLERTFGPATFAVEAALAPRQDHVAEANRYLGASSAYDAGDGWTVTVRGGYEDGFYDRKWDWEVGLGYAVGPFEAAFAYVDTDHGACGEAGRLGRAGLVASLTAAF